MRRSDAANARVGRGVLGIQVEGQSAQPDMGLLLGGHLTSEGVVLLALVLSCAQGSIELLQHHLGIAQQLSGEVWQAMEEVKGVNRADVMPVSVGLQ